MNRSYYEASLYDFLSESTDSIIGKITQKHPLSIETLQTGAWLRQIEILQSGLCLLKSNDSISSRIFFEFAIPRMGKRADVILIFHGLIFVIEFKVGNKDYLSTDIRQAHGYAIDLKNFHEESHNKLIIPILVATNSTEKHTCLNFADDNVAEPLLINGNNLYSLISDLSLKLNQPDIDAIRWSRGNYKPTPNIIEAAQALYSNHKVEDISRSDASSINISQTSETILRIIQLSRQNSQKSICFVTGVPGAGKTLVGLNIAATHSNPKEEDYSVFLSGNGPLVEVLREALARDEVRRNPGLSKLEAHRKSSQFIQNIHHFRDDGINSVIPPVENVVIFDEAQRAWDRQKTNKFMRQKRGLNNFDSSESAFLLEIMDRHTDWCVVIALIGSGQEIHTGEAGINEWFNSILDKFSHWKVYYSRELESEQYVNSGLPKKLKNIDSKSDPNLHLSTSVRSFRSEKLSKMIHYLVAGNYKNSRLIYDEFKHLYPIVVTRDLTKAKRWILEHARANETKGLVASSGAVRLAPESIFVKNRFHAKEWFLNEQLDVRSCHYLEVAATEFDIQGLELDWCLVAWDADYRYNKSMFEYWKFIGTKWKRRLKENEQRYLENSYRVLLTRARQGMAIYIPEGSQNDSTRLSDFYDSTYQFLISCGIKKLH